jgi:acetoacetate decarboxylase
MGRIRYAKSPRDRARSEGPPAAKLDARPLRMRSIRCVYETDAEASQAVVPRPLEASVGSEVCVSFVSIEMPISAGTSVEIRSVRFGVRVVYDDRPGCYLLTMPTTSEQSVMLGRERFGEPRKLARIAFDAEGDRVSASVERMGIGFLRIDGDRAEELPPRKETEIGYCFKAFPSCESGSGFDQDPQLVRLEWQHDDERVWRLDGEIALYESVFDPVADLPVRRVVDLELTEGTLRSSARIVRPVPGEWLLPFVHQRYDDPRTDGMDV